MSGGIDFRRCFVEKTQWNRELQYVCDMMKDKGIAGFDRPSGAWITWFRVPRRAVIEILSGQVS